MNLAVVILFVCAIWLPLSNEVFQFAPVIAVNENRTLVGMPEFSLTKSALKKYPQNFEDYYNDHFGFRNLLLDWHNYVSYTWLKTSDRVLIGKDGWLFLARGLRPDIRPIRITSDYCGQAPFGTEELAKWSNALATNWRSLRDRNMEYLLVVVPNKHTVYSEYLPGHVKCDRGVSRLDQLAAELQQLEDFPLLDLRARFMQQAKVSDPLFQETDTHWDGLGVLLAYQAMMADLDVDVPDLVDIGRVMVTDVERRGGDLARLLGMADQFREHSHGFRIASAQSRNAGNPFPALTRDPSRQPVAREQDNGALPRLMVFHDSFIGRSFIGLLSETFSRSVFVWHGRPDLPMELIEQENPDIIIHEMIERNLLHPYFGQRSSKR